MADPTMWKTLDLDGWAYFETDEMDRLISHVTEAAIHHEYSRDTSGFAHAKRRRLRAWFMRGREQTYEEEAAAGLYRKSYGGPEVYAMVGGEWIEVTWTLIEPTVELDPPLTDRSES